MKVIQLVAKVREFISTFLVDWALKELAFNFLPIAVIMTMNYISTSRIDFLFLSPEWSFLTIVLLGTAVTKLLKLKIKVQKDYSDNIIQLMRITVLALIFATIILALVSSQNSYPSLNRVFLGSCQFALLAFSIAMICLADTSAMSHRKKEFLLPANVGKIMYYESLSNSIDSLCKEANYLRYALSKRNSIEDDEDSCKELYILEILDLKEKLTEQLLFAKKKIDALYEEFENSKPQ